MAKVLSILWQITKWFVAAVAGVVAVVILLGIWFLFPSRDVVASVTSPDGNLLAELIEINGGATTSFGYVVRVAKVGAYFGSRQVASLYGAVRNDSAYGVNLRWRSAEA